MSKKLLLIDASHSEETRVAVLNSNILQSIVLEKKEKRQTKSNIYAARVARVEPSLQAAFVDYGNKRHGFLPFANIHPDYFRIAPDLREKIYLQYFEKQLHRLSDSENLESRVLLTLYEQALDNPYLSDPLLAQERFRALLDFGFRIQQVITPDQPLLVQSSKEERGTKGAALSTYLSLTGLYCVYYPNLPDAGSRKSENLTENKQTLQLAQKLKLPLGSSVLMRQSAEERTTLELKRDLEALVRQWKNILNKVSSLRVSRHSGLLHQEGSLIHRAIRDIYTRDTDLILVEGAEAYKEAKAAMRAFSPSQATKVQPYKDPLTPLFRHFNVERQIDALHGSQIFLPSGGSIVINQTEALVAIDVNSGRFKQSTRLSDTALATNLEAAEEIARQLRLRDLGGLIVIDFIDMSDSKNNQKVLTTFNDALKEDPARLRVGSISSFGLLELSRQRLRSSLLELTSHTCPLCSGSGLVRSLASSALSCLRMIEDLCFEHQDLETASIQVHLSHELAEYLLNDKRTLVVDLEGKFDFKILFKIDPDLPFSVFSVNLVDDEIPDIKEEEPTPDTKATPLFKQRYKTPKQSPTTPPQNPRSSPKATSEPEQKHPIQQNKRRDTAARNASPASKKNVIRDPQKTKLESKTHSTTQSPTKTEKATKEQTPYNRLHNPKTKPSKNTLNLSKPTTTRASLPNPETKSSPKHHRKQRTITPSGLSETKSTPTTKESTQHIPRLNSKPSTTRKNPPLKKQYFGPSRKSRSRSNSEKKDSTT